MDPLNRRRFVKGSCALLTAGALAPSDRSFSIDARAAVLDIAGEPQLLLDDHLIAERKGLKRTLHQPQKQGLIKETDGADWERGDVYPPTGNVVCRDLNGRFHMNCRYMWWDESVKGQHPGIGEDRAHWFRQTVGYATSEDGIHWRRPELGLIEGPTGFKKIEAFPFEAPIGMSRRNSLGCPIDFIVDLAAHGNIHDPVKRYLLRLSRMADTHPFAEAVERQMYYASDYPDLENDPDWKSKLTPIAGANLSPRGFQSLAGYDVQAGEWFAVSQDSIGNWLPRGGRDIARFASPDLVKWNGGELVLPVGADESKTPEDWIEYMNLDAYRVGGPKSGAWLGQLLIFHSDRTSPEYQWPFGDGVWRKGTTELRLVLSRDAGRSWQRICEKEIWLPHSPEPHGFDRLAFGTYPIRVGDEMWFYYLAYDGDHLIFNRDGSLHEPGFIRKGRTALATLRWDGYVSLDAGREAARLLTRPLRFSGRELTVNLSAPRGALQAELRDNSGEVIPGYAFADNEPTSGDSLELPVRWRGSESLASLNGKTVRIAFELKDASLYGFQFG